MRLAKLTAATLLAAGALACASASTKPTVDDYDTYQIISIGNARYITPNGFSAGETASGRVDHRIAGRPDTLVRVQVLNEAPSTLKFDIDREQRRFLSEVPGSALRSVQHKDDGPRTTMNVMASGRAENGQPVYGTMYFVREAEDTVLVKVMGPYKDRDDLDRIAEKIARDLHFAEHSPAVAVQN